MPKPIPYLTLDEAIDRLQKIKEKVGTGQIPFLAHGARASELVLCDIWLSRSGASDVYRLVSRGGQPVAVVAMHAPDKDPV